MRRCKKKWSRLRQLAQGLLVSYGTILIILACAEAYFRFIYAESTGYYTLAQVNWINRYYHENSYGFRDREWQAEDFLGKTVITVIGDSFTAGNGINEPADRYSDVLGTLLDEDYTVLNMGLPGSATPTQLEALQNFDLANPNIVIWQYFLNDIEFAAMRVSDFPPLEPPPSIAQESYLLNYLYFRLSPPQSNYWTWLYSNYDNALIWDLHRQEIQAMVDYVDSLDAELIVVIYPHMLEPVQSIAYVDRVAQAIQATGHDNILKLFNDVAAWSPDVPLIVSAKDAHPSIEFNAYVAQRLYELYFED